MAKGVERELGEDTERRAAVVPVRPRRRYRRRQRHDDRCRAGERERPPPERVDGGRGEQCDRDDERQRVTHRRRLVEQEMEDGVRDERDRAQDERAPVAPAEAHRAGSREHQHRDAEPVLFPRPDERVQNRQRGDLRLPRRPQHHDAGEVFAGLRAERRQVALEAAARGKQRNRPHEHTGESCHEGEQPVADREPGSRPHEHREEQRRRQHHRLDPDTRGQAAQRAGEISQPDRRGQPRV